MKIDYEALEAYLKEHKKALESMTDIEFNDHINSVLEKFHAEESPKKENRACARPVDERGAGSR